MGDPTAPAEFASLEIRVFSKLAKAGFVPSTIFDIGASNGTWSSLVSDLFPDASFHLFEPLANVISSYQELLHSHMQCRPTFKLHTVALGSAEKSIAMHIHSDGFSSTILPMKGHPDFQSRYEVPQYTLDGYVERFALPLPDLIKLDVQGAEQMILSKASRCLKHASLVFAETWFERAYGPDTPLITDLCGLLESQGYRLAEIGHRFYDADHRLYGCDAFFIKREFLAQVASRMPAWSW